MRSSSSFQRCDVSQWNVVNTRHVLPIVDAHCHIFGQSLYEGGDVMDLLASKDPLVAKGIRRFLAYTMSLGRDNAWSVLKAIPENPTENKVAKDVYAKAAVPLLLDMGYTPLPPLGPEFLDLGYRGQALKTEAEQIADTDQTRVYPDKSGMATLRLESLYCKETEDYTGDDEIRIEVYSDQRLLKVVPTITVDHNNQTRMINEEVLFDPSTTVRIFLYEVDLDSADDSLGTRPVVIDQETSGWKTLRFSGSEDASKGTEYELTYSVRLPDSSGGGDGGSGGSGQLVLQLQHLTCVQQEDWTGQDRIRIEVTTSGGMRKFGPYGCQKGSSTGVSENMVLDSDAVVKLWEYDPESADDCLGEAKIARKQASAVSAPFHGDDAKYQLVYSVTPGDGGPKDDTFYKSDKKYLWFKRDRETFRGAIRALAQDAAFFPGEIWPMLPFDPRRPDGLDFVKEAIEQLGFAGVKLYSRCGWMPLNNREIYGDALGDKLDQRLRDFYKYMTDNDLPVLVHCSPTGYPPDGMLVFPSSYHQKEEKPAEQDSQKEKKPTEDFSGLPFPPLSTGGYTGRHGGPLPRPLRHVVTEQCEELAIYCHYVQKTTSPYAWDPVFSENPQLRLCFGHSGSAAGIYWKYKDSIEKDLSADESGLGKTFKKSDLLKHAVPENPFAGPDDPSRPGTEWRFRERFIRQVVGKVEKELAEEQALQNASGGPCGATAFDLPFTSEIRADVEAFLSAGGDPEWEWNKWFAAWEKAYPYDWTTKIVSLEEKHANVYADVSYLSGEEREIFVELLAKLLEDAEKGTKDGGQAMANKHIVGTDWYMLEGDKMTAEDFWDRVADEKALPLSHPLRKKWVTENALDWLNLRDRLGGKGLETLETFYRANVSDYKPPLWWESLEAYYASKSKDGGADSDTGPEPKEPKPIPREWLPDSKEVRILQERLTELGHDPGVIDGLWGPNTKAALKEFQSRDDVDLVKDGIYGPKTRAELDRIVNG